MSTSTQLIYKFSSRPQIAIRERAIIEGVINERVQKSNVGTSGNLAGLSATSLDARNAQSDNEILTDLFSPKSSPPRSRLLPLNEWEGVVESIDRNDGTFGARLNDITTPEMEDEFAEFNLEDVGEDDMLLLRPGAVFRWVIGMRTAQSGTVERTSKLVFRRLPAYSRSDIQAADLRAERLAGAIKSK